MTPPKDIGLSRAIQYYSDPLPMLLSQYIVEQCGFSSAQIAYMNNKLAIEPYALKNQHTCNYCNGHTNFNRILKFFLEGFSVN